MLLQCRNISKNRINQENTEPCKIPKGGVSTGGRPDKLMSGNRHRILQNPCRNPKPKQTNKSTRAPKKKKKTLAHHQLYNGGDKKTEVRQLLHYTLHMAQYMHVVIYSTNNKIA
jgi:hypothetical protein